MTERMRRTPGLDGRRADRGSRVEPFDNLPRHPAEGRGTDDSSGGGPEDDTPIYRPQGHVGKLVTGRQCSDRDGSPGGRLRRLDVPWCPWVRPWGCGG